MNTKAIVVGISNYEVLGKLPGAANSAIDFAKHLLKSGFSHEDVRLFISDIDLVPDELKVHTSEVTEALLLQAIRDIRKQPPNNLIFYWAGHGFSFENVQHLVVSDQPDDRVVTSFEKIAASLRGFNKKVIAEQLFIFDTCSYSGWLPHEFRPLGIPIDPEVLLCNQSAVFASRIGGQTVFGETGCFTDIVLEVISDLKLENWTPVLVGESSPLIVHMRSLRKEDVAIDTPTISIITAQDRCLRRVLDGKRPPIGVGSELKGISPAEFSELFHMLEIHRSLLTTACALAKTLFAWYIPPSFGTWSTLLERVGDVGYNDTLAFVVELLRTVEQLEGLSGDARFRVLAEQLENWAEIFSCTHNLNMSAKLNAKYWSTFLLSPRPDAKDRFDVSEWFWSPDIDEVLRPKPIGMRAVDLHIGDAIQCLQERVTSLQERIQIKSSHISIEVFLPVSFFDLNLEGWPSPRDRNLELGITLGEDYPISRRPTNYCSILSREEKMKFRQEIPGIAFINDEDVRELRLRYDDDHALDHGCVGLRSAPEIHSGSGKRDIFAAILGTGMPAMLWFRSATHSADSRECEALAEMKLCNTKPTQLPEAIFKHRRLAYQGKENPAWKGAILIVDGPDRVPRELRENS